MTPLRAEISPEPVTFQEAIEAFKSKVPLSADEFARLSTAAKARAFSVARMQSADLVAQVQDSLRRAMEEGVSFRDWKAGINDLLAKRGVDPLEPWHLDTVFRQNVQSAYQAGRWKQMTEPYVLKRRPYLQYVIVRDGHARKTHADQDGKIYPKTHPYWDEWYPPNGFGCRCGTVDLSQEEVDEEELKVETRSPITHPDPGFEVNVGKGAFGDRVMEAISQDMADLVPVFSGGPAQFGRPQVIPPKAFKPAPELLPPPEVLARDLSRPEVQDFYRDAYRSAVGIPEGRDAVEISDVLGESIMLNMGGIDYLLRKEPSRVRFIPYILPTIQAPYEIWLVEETTAKGVRYRKRYIALYRDGKARPYLVVVNQFDPYRWGILNAYPLETKSLKQERSGVLLYGEK